MSEVEVYYEAGDHDGDVRAQTTASEDGERILQRLREAGIEYRAVDVSGLSSEALRDTYFRVATPPSVWKRYRVRELFGTQKYPGAFFGRSVPALVVFEDGRPVDVYPHQEGGKIVSIDDYIDSVTRSSRAVELARRMDALRARIGTVDATASELIEEGRRR